MDGEQIPITTSTPPETPPKSSKKLLWILLAAALVIAGGLVAFTMGKDKAGNKTAGSSSDAATKLYDVLGNAAKQQKIHVGMYRETYANKADAAAKRNIGSIAASVSEVDVASGKYRSVYALNFLESDKSFTIGRCVDGVRYTENYPASTKRATSLQEAARHLALAPEGHLFKSTIDSSVNVCKQAGLYPLDTSIAAARLSDGVFPVALTEARAGAWTKAIKEANLFTVKDEGVVTRDGKQLRKISFAPKDEKGTNKKLYNIFYAAAQIEQVKANPQEIWEFEFVTVNPANSGGVGGFYMIDEQTKLPVYSELYGTNPEKHIEDSEGAGRNLARTKQTYAFPNELTIDVTTPLELLE